MTEAVIKLNDLSTNDRKNLVGTSGTSGSTKIQIIPAQPKTLSHSTLPSRPAVELAFTDLTYRVKEGRSNSKYNKQFISR
jgi:hypothetical protein